MPVSADLSDHAVQPTVNAGVTIPPAPHVQAVQRLKDLTQPLWDAYPEYLAAGLEIAMTSPAVAGEAGTWIRALRRYVNEAESPSVDLPSVDVVIFCSNFKPSYWPALGQLADNLADAGYAVALILRTTIEIRTRGAKGRTVVQAVSKAPYGRLRTLAFSEGQGRKNVWRGIRAAARLFVRGLLRDPAVARLVARNPAAIVSHLTMSAHRFDVARLLLDRLQPRLLVVNIERTPLGAELVQSPARRGALRVQICNEPPRHIIVPFLSEEVWVWNQLAADLVEAVAPRSRTVVIGSNEVDVALQPPDPPGDAERALRDAAAGRPTLLLLSEYFPDAIFDAHERPLIIEELRWLAEAARAHPGWFFIYRPRNERTAPPGWAQVEHLPNVTTSSPEIGYRQFLAWDNLLAVGAVGSSGLFAAAGTGKTAIRLKVTDNRYCWPVIEQVSVTVHSPAELVNAIGRIDTTRSTREVAPELASSFPFRGCTLQRMTDLCLDRLKAPGTRAQSA
ncbi:MAG: hypothetical protein AB7P67_02535 [Vicinamibacterales bacterium]